MLGLQFVWALFGMIIAFSLAIGIALFFFRSSVKKLWVKFIDVFERDPYAENLWELVILSMRMHPQKIIENNMRAAGGVIIKRPMGSSRPMPDFRGLMFLPNQMAKLPTEEGIEIDTRTIIGPGAKRPLELDIPLMISGLGVGLGISNELKLALAKGSAMVGTATNTGEGPFWSEERKYAKKLILQYSRAKWAKDPNILKQADMIEIHIGQGASGPAPSQVPAKHLKERERKLLGVPPRGRAEILSRMPGVTKKQDWRNLVEKLRKLTGGVPIGMKMIPSRVEEDIEIALYAGVDFITLDGAQAGTKGTAPILQDDLGLPTIIGLCRAVDYLEKKKKKDEVSLIISGGFKNPGEHLKALALGADAVALGVPAVIAASHLQGSHKMLPWEAPTQLVWYEGDMTDQFDIEQGAKHLAYYLQSCVEEMCLAAIALGKTSLREVNKEDLVAMDQQTAMIAKVPLM